MAKKFVRGITDVKTINNQDYDTNNVNDLLSDGQYNYIHRKKGKSEEYHNLTDNIKTLSSDNTDLLAVTNNNKTTNTATLRPKHDKQKEQVIESTRNTVTINHGTNGTAEKTTVDTNPQKVLEHENLLTDYGISKTTSGNTTKLSVDYTLVSEGFDLNNLVSGRVRCANFVNSPLDNTFFFVTAYSEGSNIIQEAVKLFSGTNVKYIRQKTAATSNEWSAWREQFCDLTSLSAMFNSKQDKLIAGEGITIEGQTISATGGAHDSQKEQVLESTRNTVTIQHGENGTAEKTTVDTNPEKVLEHENLISDSEYITLNHQTGENATHIQAVKLKEKLDNLQQTKQDVLVAGKGIIIDGHTISTIATQNITFYTGEDYRAFREVFTNPSVTFETFTFDCEPQFTERVLTANIKVKLQKYVRAGMSVSNGAISITNDGTNIKLINSAGSQNVHQQGTFTFSDNNPTGGGGGASS